MSDLETIVNKWYLEWLNLHDQFEDDFESELQRALPHLSFTLNLKTAEWLLIK